MELLDEDAEVAGVGVAAGEEADDGFWSDLDSSAAHNWPGRPVRTLTSATDANNTTAASR
ncbi:MAG: hypothetical protein HYZ92_00490 [Candidatus Omnitrophica bacterium]|nr:hypothetical protein [Candidatus Omnitrophota bacterium]